MPNIECPEQPRIPNCDPSCIKGRNVFILIEDDPVFFPANQSPVGQIVIEGPCSNDPFWRPNEYTEEQWEILQPKLLECRLKCCDDNCNTQKTNCLNNGNFWSDCKGKCITDDTCGEFEIWIENGQYREFLPIGNEQLALVTETVCGCVCIDDYNEQLEAGCGQQCTNDSDCSGDCNICNIYNTCEESGSSDVFLDRTSILKLISANQEIENKCIEQGYDFYRASRDNLAPEEGNCGACDCTGNRVYDENLKKCFLPNIGSCCGVLITTRLKDSLDDLTNSPSGVRRPREFKCHNNVNINNCCGEFFEGQECNEDINMSEDSSLCCDESTMPDDIREFLEDNIFGEVEWVATAFRCAKDNQCYWCLVPKNSYLPAPVFDHQECRCRECKEDNLINEQPPCIDTISIPHFPKGIRDKDTCECCKSEQVWYECNNPEHPIIAQKIAAGLESVTGICRLECRAFDPDNVERALNGISIWNKETCECECETEEDCETKFGIGFTLSGNCECQCNRDVLETYCESKNLIFVRSKCGCSCTDAELTQRLNKCPPDAIDRRLCECDCTKARDVFGALKYPLKPGHVYNEYCDSVCPAAVEQNIRPPLSPTCDDGGFFMDSSKYYIKGETALGIGNCECSYCPLGFRPYLCDSEQTIPVQIGGTEQFPIIYNFPVVYVSCVEFPCEEPRVITECGHPIYKLSRVCSCEPSGDPNSYPRQYNPQTNECECVFVPQYGVKDCYDEPLFFWNNNTCQCECKEFLINGQIQSHGDYCQQFFDSSHNHWIRKAIVGNPNPQLTPNPNPPPALIFDYETSCLCVCDLKDTDCDPGYKVNKQNCECEYEKWVCNDLEYIDGSRPGCDGPIEDRCSKVLSPPSEEDLNGRTLFDSEDECIHRCCVGACCYRMLFEPEPFLEEESSFGNNMCEDDVKNEHDCEMASRNYITPVQFLSGKYQFFYGLKCSDIDCNIDIDSSSSSTSSEGEPCDILAWKYIVYIDNNNELQTMIASDADDFESVNIFAVFKTETMMNSFMNILTESLRQEQRFGDGQHKCDSANWIPLQCDKDGHTGRAIWSEKNFDISPGLNPIYQAEFIFRRDENVDITNLVNLISNSHKYWYSERAKAGFDLDSLSEFLCIEDMTNSVAIITDLTYQVMTFESNKDFADSLCVENSSSSSSEDIVDSSSSSTSSSSEDIIESSSSTSSEDITCEGPCLSELGETICPNDYCDCIGDMCVSYAAVSACCTGNGQCTPVVTQSDCDDLGGTFLDGQSCASCPMGVCGCDYSLNRIRLLVVDNSNPNNPVMADRTSEAVSSFNWSGSGGHDWVAGTCTRPGCSGGNTHISCTIYNKDGSISYCGSDCKEYSPELCAGCECDFTVANPFLDDPIPGAGGTLPGNRQIYDSEINEFRNSVNANSFISVNWKPGYPAAFNGASYAVWRDFFIPFASYFVEPNCSGCDCSGTCDENLTCISPCVCQDGICVDGRLSYTSCDNC